MKKLTVVTVFLLTLFFALFLFRLVPYKWSKLSVVSADTLLLLVPDNRADPTVISIWKNMAQAEGFHLEICSDSEFLLPITQQRAHFQGVILADSLHTRMSPFLAETLKKYIRKGGNVFLIYDAGTKTSKGKIRKEALLAPLLGFSYGPKQGKTQDLIGQDKVTLNELGVPPGKCIENSTTRHYAESPFCAISTYLYGKINYWHYKTEPIKNEIPLLLTTWDRQFIAGLREYGKGKILFVNLPLTTLFRQTDSLLLQVFARYFAFSSLKLPELAQVPNGVGGLILNLHAESKDSIRAFALLNQHGLFKQGPYSIDFTVGPDVDYAGDKKGYDLLNNSQAQYWVNYLAKRGNEIGSDGGWMHNYFGQHADEENQPIFSPYITKNKEILEKVLKKKVKEYVPSMGNQPSWVSPYLQKIGVIAYYTTSNMGAAPGTNFRNGAFDALTLWSFPCLPLGVYASISDFGFANLSAEVVTNWFLDSTDFVAKQHTSRLIYFHPHDFLYFDQYLPALETWLATTQNKQTAGVFNWYTMVDIAQFLTARRTVYWKVERGNEGETITASHIQSLNQQAWLFDKSSYTKPQVLIGEGSVKEDETHWIVAAGNTKFLQFITQRH